MQLIKYWLDFASNSFDFVARRREIGFARRSQQKNCSWSHLRVGKNRHIFQPGFIQVEPAPNCLQKWHETSILYVII